MGGFCRYPRQVKSKFYSIRMYQLLRAVSNSWAGSGYLAREGGREGRFGRIYGKLEGDVNLHYR